MRFHSHINSAIALIQAYDGSMPLTHYLKQYFSLYKKHGSKDRKYISHLCYCYYRLGHALKTISVEERLKAALFLCDGNIKEWAVVFDTSWMEKHSTLLEERIAFIQTILPFNGWEIFPWQDELSEGIDGVAFAASHLTQPDLFLRLRPGKEDIVKQKLQQQNIPYTQIASNALAMPNTTKIDTVIDLNKEAVVQDYSSQQIQKFFPLIQSPSNNAITVWDCCAASGGKSILAVDALSNIQLTVSDIRQSIMHNLQQRFKEAGINHYKSLVIDLINPQSAIRNLQSDLIICDAPCTGSGTWGRTPEQLYFFHPEKINHYATLQQKIVRTVIPQVKAGGYFLYITCSVFAQENEAAVNIIQQHGLTLIGNEVLVGYDKKADTMFAALFKK